MEESFYETLGLSREASVDEIKRAYRRLARENHPDKNPDNPQAESRFKAVSEAYDVLSDPEKRALYDQFGRDGLREGFNPEAARAHAAGFHSGFARGDAIHMDMGDLSELFGSLGGFGGPARQGSDIELTLHLSFAEAVDGTSREVRYRRPTRCRTCDARGIVDGRPCPTCRGQRVIQSEKTVTVRIPPGADSGDVIRLRGKGGEPRSPRGQVGDVIATLVVDSHHALKREGIHLVASVEIEPVDAITGTRVEVQALEKSIRVSVPPGVRSGQRLRVPEHGIARQGRKGHLYVEVTIDGKGRKPTEKAIALADELRQELQRDAPPS